MTEVMPGRPASQRAPSHPLQRAGTVLLASHGLPTLFGAYLVVLSGTNRADSSVVAALSMEVERKRLLPARPRRGYGHVGSQRAAAAGAAAAGAAAAGATAAHDVPGCESDVGLRLEHSERQFLGPYDVPLWPGHQRLLRHGVEPDKCG
eukprot:COSAG06_NODE_3684_length_5015_cov_4.312246_3_plen_149_part_00